MLLFSHRLFGVSVSISAKISSSSARHALPTAHSEGARHHGLIPTTNKVELRSGVDASLGKLVTPLLLLPEMCCRFCNCSKDN